MQDSTPSDWDLLNPDNYLDPTTPPDLHNLQLQPLHQQQQLNADETMLEYRQPSSNYSSVSSVSPAKELMDLQDGQDTQPVDNTEHQAAAALPSHQINTLHYPPTSVVTLNQESLKSKRVYQYKGKKRENNWPRRGRNYRVQHPTPLNQLPWSPPSYPVAPPRFMTPWFGSPFGPWNSWNYMPPQYWQPPSHSSGTGECRGHDTVIAGAAETH
uniref:Uncharacterized protein n=1 Tax=Ditylenchus dipsaci TaxID=166011 RepID=A0A915CQT7_9BILA